MRGIADIRQSGSEFLGSAFLLAAVAGSGIMAERLAGGNTALALLGNTIPTAAILFVLITILGPVSGAHLNPAVSLAMRLRGEIETGNAVRFICCQTAGAIAGVWLAHLMFALPVAQISTTMRWGPAQWLSEFVASFGLVLTIFGCLARNRGAAATAVALYIAAAYWFTASTSFANPAVTIARALTDTFSGIAPSGIIPFIAAQLAGASAAAAVSAWLWPQGNGKPDLP